MDARKRQHLADYLTTAALTAVYGERFLELNDVEDDSEINDMWWLLNEKFYITLKVFSNE